jgi:hypothetical protein
MKRKRFTEEQIIAVLKEHEAGFKAPDLCRKHGISKQTFYNWKAKYGGLDVSDARRLKSGSFLQGLRGDCRERSLQYRLHINPRLCLGCKQNKDSRTMRLAPRGGQQ